MIAGSFSSPAFRARTGEGVIIAAAGRAFPINIYNAKQPVITLLNKVIKSHDTNTNLMCTSLLLTNNQKAGGRNVQALEETRLFLTSRPQAAHVRLR